MTIETAAPRADGRTGNLIAELGLLTTFEGDEVHAAATVTPEMVTPDTGTLRTSILLAWTDVLAGFQAIAALAPLVPVTLDLSIEQLRHTPAGTVIRAAARVVKKGGSVFTAEVDYSVDDELVAVGLVTFMVEPSAELRLPPVQALIDGFAERVSTLDEPYAERSDCTRISPGRASMQMSKDKLNTARMINGGLIAIVIDEAVLSASGGRTLDGLTVRYLRPGRVGPFVATAELSAGLARIEVRDAGADDRLLIVATGRVGSAEAGDGRPDRQDD